MSKAHALAKPLPLNFLLRCSDAALDNYELARLNELANIRKEMQALLDRMIDVQSQAAIAAWFKSQDRNSLKHAIENEQTPEEWAKRLIRDGQRSAEELIPRATLEPGVAQRAASLRYTRRNIAAGLCSVCPEPLDRNSVRYCTEHLEKHRQRDTRYRQKQGAEPGTHGRQPGTLASLAMNREKATRALLNELGVKPEHAAVSLNAAIEALARIMPREKSEAMTQAELFEKAGIVTKTTGQKALAELLAAGTLERIGKGGPRDLYRYWRKP